MKKCGYKNILDYNNCYKYHWNKIIVFQKCSNPQLWHMVILDYGLIKQKNSKSPLDFVVDFLEL